MISALLYTDENSKLGPLRETIPRK